MSDLTELAEVSSILKVCDFCGLERDLIAAFER